LKIRIGANGLRASMYDLKICETCVRKTGQNSSLVV
jgi:hypothetical protein